VAIAICMYSNNAAELDAKIFKDAGLTIKSFELPRNLNIFSDIVSPRIFLDL
jgi:hypothetical protein